MKPNGGGGGGEMTAGSRAVSNAALRGQRQGSSKAKAEAPAPKLFIRRA